MEPMIWVLVVGWLVGWLTGGVVVASRRSARPAGAATGRSRWGWFSLRAWPLVLVVLAVGVPFGLIDRSPGQTTAGELVLFGLVLAISGLGLFSLGLSLAGHDPAAERVAGELATDPAARLLLTRWLARTRWRRWLGGLLGAVTGLLVLGSGAGMASLALAGLMIGSCSAELHHLRGNRRSGPRTAGLTQRRLGDYTVRREQMGLGIVAAGSLVALVAGLVAAEPTGVRWAALGLLTLAATLALQWRIAVRRRPALPAELHEADDLARHLAVSRGVARPGLALGSAFLAQAVGALGVSSLAAVIWVVAVGLFWWGRGLGIDRLATRSTHRRPAIGA